MQPPCSFETEGFPVCRNTSRQRTDAVPIYSYQSAAPDMNKSKSRKVVKMVLRRKRVSKILDVRLGCDMNKHIYLGL